MADAKHDRIAQVEHLGGQEKDIQNGAEADSARTGDPDAPLSDKPAVKGDLRGLQPPEFLRHMTMEQRLVLENKLKRKIDIRLMPMIILMYILNYIDRYVSPDRCLARASPSTGGSLLTRHRAAGTTSPRRGLPGSRET